MLASLMTISEYQATVTPLFKNFSKFIRKNEKYFKKKNFYGITYQTFPEFLKNEMEHLLKYHPILAKNDEYAKERWQEGSYLRTYDNIPIEIKNQYDDFIKEFSKYFTLKEIDEQIDRDEVKSNKKAVRRAIDNDFYIDALKDKQVTPQRLEEIFTSVGIKMPKRILELKTKVETQGYDRSIELLQAKKTKDFEEKIRTALGPHFEKLKDLEKERVLNIVNEFEAFDKQNDFYYFLKKYDNFPSYKSYVNRILDNLFTGNYNQETSRKLYVKKRRENFDEIIDRICTDFAENFISLFVQRVELKLRIINSKKGAPEFEITNVDLNGLEFEGIITATWSDGTVIKIDAHVIIAGGYNIQITHYRYLLTAYYNGKKINLEALDALNFD